MIINTNSWHARFHDKFYDRHSRPHSLCAYFWKIVWACFAITMIIVSIGIGCTVAGAALLAKFFTLGTIPGLVGGFFVGLISAAAIVGAIIGAIVGIVKIELWYDLHKEDKEWERIQLKKQGIEPPKRNFVYEFLKARKSKMCPVIHFEDKE